MVKDLNVSTVYGALVEIGADISNHASDLYVRITPEVEAVMSRLEGCTVSRFNSNIDGSAHYEIAFAYTPFWEAKLNKGAK